MQSSISERSLSGALVAHAPELGSWAAREEARKSWDHFLCDKGVYFAQPPDVNLESPHIFSEKYVRNDLWFHIRWTQLDAGQAGDHYNEAIIESVVVHRSGNACRKLDRPVAAIDRNSAMFVEIPEFIELPEIFRLYGGRSVFRLKRIKSGVDAGVEQGPFIPISLIVPADREGNSVSGSFIDRDRTRKRVDQVPSQLIERGTETVNEVCHSERDLFGRSAAGDYEKVIRSVGIILFAHGVRVTIDPIAKSFFSRLEVKVSPSGFHVDVLN
jgi:hypothetical protein